MMRNIIISIICLTLFSDIAWGVDKKATPTETLAPALAVEVIKIKNKSSWTELTIAIQNLGTTDATISCCTAYLEDSNGYAIASLTRNDLLAIIHNKARTAATIGSMVGLGMGVGGAVGNINELEYAGIAVGGASVIGGVVGEAAAESQARNLIIDDIMRNKTFPAELKVAGKVFFPPRRKWPSDSRVATALHITYEINGKQYKAKTIIPEEAYSKPRKRSKR